MSREEFTAYIRKVMKDYDIDFLTMSEICDVSVTTVRRWVSGKNVPHEYMHEGIVKEINDSLAGEGTIY